MQIKLFTVPVGDSGGALQEMNAFLRGNIKNPGLQPGAAAGAARYPGLQPQRL